MIKNNIWIVSEINVDEPIPKIKCFKFKNYAAFQFDSMIKTLSEKYDYTQEFKKGESFTRIFGNHEDNEIKVVLQLLCKELHD